MKNIKIVKFLSIFMLLALMSGCQSSKSTVGGYLDLDTDLSIEFIVERDINPDELGTASPLFVRLYELNSTKMMKKADFIDIYEQDKKTLDSDMVAVHKLKRFKPGENRTEQLVLDPKTGFVALYAEFLNFQESKFKLIIPVVANNVFKNSAKIRISGNELILVK